MGVRGLEKYIKSHGLLQDFYFPWNPITDICDSLLELYLGNSTDDAEDDIIKSYIGIKDEAPIPIVISGRSLLHFLYRKNFHCVVGGEYRKFREIILEFFKSFSSYNIKIEGIVFNSKYQEFDIHPMYVENNMQEAQRRSNIAIKDAINNQYRFDQLPQRTSIDPPLPLLTLPVMINTLNELQLPLYLSEGTCDEDITIFANEKNAYVLALDSDFAIYPLCKGYFLLDTLDLHEEGMCKLFPSHVDLAEKFGLAPSYLPLYAVIMGCHLLPTWYLQKFYKDYPWDKIDDLHFHILHLLLFYQGQGFSLEQAMNAFIEKGSSTCIKMEEMWEIFKKSFQQATNAYAVQGAQQKVKRISSLDPYGYFVNLQKHMFIPEVPMEPSWRSSAWLISRPFRKKGYARLQSTDFRPVIEIIRMNRFSHNTFKVLPSPTLIFCMNNHQVISVLNLLIREHALSLHGLLALVLAFHQLPPHPVTRWGKNGFHAASFSLLSLFETSLISWHIATGKPIVNTIEGPSLHYFFSELKRIKPRRISIVFQTLIEAEKANLILSWFPILLGNSFNVSPLIPTKNPWLLDWPSFEKKEKKKAFTLIHKESIVHQL